MNDQQRQQAQRRVLRRMHAVEVKIKRAESRADWDVYAYLNDDWRALARKLDGLRFA